MKGSKLETIAIRAYSEALKGEPVAGYAASRANDAPSDWSLVLDCETTTDAAQRLRFGFYQVRRRDRCAEEGVFFDPDALTAHELNLLQHYAARFGLTCRPVSDFIEKVFYRCAYDRRGTVIGFNLPFDLSRLAIGHGSAHGKSMRGGFSFRLSRFQAHARVRVKHLSRRASLIDFARPGKQETARGSRKRDLWTPPHRGFFVDIRTLAATFLSEGFTLARLCERLGVQARKIEGVEHGAALTEDYLAYARMDVQATWECYVALRTQYQKHALSTPLHRIFSEASLGKAYLKDMGVAPLLQSQPDFPRALFGKIMGAYYGGRAEVHWRRAIKRVHYCDFKSMYPTVNALMGLWRFVIAKDLIWRDGTDAARRLLAAATPDLFRDKDVWRSLTVIVRVRPDSELFPVRAKYDDRMHTIGLNYLTHRGDLWMTLADCVAAKILIGKAPIIEEAILFEAGPPQEGLRPINLFGNAAHRVDPLVDDVFARLVDLRDAAKDAGDHVQSAIKILANAVSYGIYIEIIRDDAPKPAPMAIYGPSGGRRLIQAKAIEEPGRFFHPLLGVLITGAARLMLALAERNVLDAGLDWAFCDTDSIAIVKPEDLSEEAFQDRCDGVVDWFAALNPYQKPGSILKVEEINFSLGTDGKSTGALEPRYCWAISAKRYALFNVDENRTPIIRKASAHGLGHYIAPYTDADALDDIPPPAMALSDIGVERWQYDLWYKIVEAALAGHPDHVALNYHPALQRPAASRYGLTSPALASWMADWNADRAYADQARPFGFMVAFQMRKSSAWDGFGQISDAPKRGRPAKRPELKPIAPFDKDVLKAASHAFDRETGAPVDISQLKAYADALAQFHLHPEDKFLGGDYVDRGRTRRRHVIATSIRLIGKEANKWEEQEIIGMEEDVAVYGLVAAPRGR